MRIVSLVPSLTELLFALGLGEYGVGRTGFCIHPRDSVASIAKVGGTKTFDIEKIRSLSPTHLVVNKEENPRESVGQISEFVPNLVVTDPVTVQDNIALYRQFGEVFNVMPAAQQLIDQFESAHQRLLSQKFAPLQLIYLIWRDPWMTVASDTFISQMLAQAGMTTIPDTSARGRLPDNLRYPQISEQQMADLRPGAILLSTEPYRFRESHCELIRAIDGLDATPCRLIDGEMTSWFGPRAIKGVKYLTEFRMALDADR